jgi:Zn-dependent protease
MLLLWLIQLLLENPLKFLIAVTILMVPLLISITIHEWAHGFAAYKFGDETPKIQGRLSFNPFAHLDPMGTIMLLIIGIGWAKPVMINPNNIDSKFKLMLVALAGPASNLILAFLTAFLVVFVTKMPDFHLFSKDFFLYLLHTIVRINLMLAMFNLIPIPPLDGSNIVKFFMPESLARSYEKLAPYGMIILLILLYTVGFDSIYKIAEFIERGMYSLIKY